VDRFLDMCRTVVNITGDAVCAVVVASTEGQLVAGTAGTHERKTAPDGLHARPSEPS
jgi:Na+/H+-dicarboxylate symporter